MRVLSQFASASYASFSRVRRPLTAAAFATVGTAIAANGGLTVGGPGPAMSAAGAAPFVRVVSYNVLSSHLCAPDHFLRCAPDALDPPQRLARIKTLLRPHLEEDAVICLQEVSAPWIGELTPFFEEAGYTFVTGSYGSPFNGYMGVSLAWPTARFSSEEVAVTRVADTKSWPSPPRSEEPPRSKLRVALCGAWASLSTLWRAPQKRPFDVWSETRRRHNFLVSANLRCKRSGRRVSVSTYHMPCLFGSDAKVQVMTNHAALAAQQALRFAGEGTPCVLAGDFNIKPADAPYKLLTTGTLPEEDPHMPPAAPHGDVWRPTLPKPMRSAYVLASGSEPEFTNLAMTKFAKPGEPPFCETLDYIFVSDGWTVKAVRPLPSKEAVLDKGGVESYPTLEEPSDHTMIWADLGLV